MLTASLVIYHNPLPEIETVLNCALRSPFEWIYIVDNSCNDSLRILEHRSPKIRYIHNLNTGYIAHNIAIREAMALGAKYHAVLNPDISFEPETINELIHYMEAHEDVGWVMPKVIYPDGRLQYLCKLLPTPADLILRRFFPKSWFPKSQKRFEMRFLDYDTEVDVPYLSGCFMFLRTEVLCKTGLFDEQFFMYAEDIDLSRRMHAMSRTVYYPAVSIVHAHEDASYKNRRMLYVHIRNIVLYFNKWGWFFDRERRRANKAVLKRFDH